MALELGELPVQVVAGERELAGLLLLAALDRLGDLGGDVETSLLEDVALAIVDAALELLLRVLALAIEPGEHAVVHLAVSRDVDELEQLTLAGPLARERGFNYCAHDTNNSDVDADRVKALFDPSIWEATVSVICERNEFETAKNEHQRNLAVDFSSKLLERGFNVRVFDPAGMDTIGGGCGQLWFVQDWMRQNPDKARPSVGHGLEKVHTPRGCDTKPITLHRSIASV